MNVDEALAEIARIARESRVYAYRYASDNVSRAVFDDAMKKLTRLQKEAKGSGTTSGASVWRTRSISDPDVWQVIVCQGAETNLVAEIEWGAGIPVELEERMQLALVERHLSQMLNEYDPETGQAQFRAHYGMGADLRRGGELTPRIGRDE